MSLRIAVVGGLLLLLAAAPAAAAAKCTRSATGSPLSARIVTDHPSTGVEPKRAWLVACDRRAGRRRVLRRTKLRTRRGRDLVALSVAGRRVAWLEVVVRPSSSVGVVVVADGRTGRRVERRRAFRGGPFRAQGALGVALTTRGELAWNTPTATFDLRVVLALPGEPARELARGRLGRVRVEDDGTLVWFDELGARTVDLPGRDFGAGCPKRRSRYRMTGTDFGGVVFTRADERARSFSDVAVSYLRACDRRTGIDAIVAVADSDEVVSEQVSSAGGGNGWAAVVRRGTTRYDGCPVLRLSTVEIATRRRGREATELRCDGGIPLSEQTVVTAAGAPAWIAPGTPARLMTIDAGGMFAELDRGAIADVATDGEDVVWTNGGEPRRARP